MLDFGEDLLDRIEVGRVWRQEQQFGPDTLDSLANRIALVGREIVHHHDVAWMQLGNEKLFDPSQKDRAVHRAIYGHRRDNLVMTQRGDEGHGLPMPMRRMADQALAARTSTVTAYHVGCRPHFVDEDETLGVNLFLIAFPEPAGQSDIAALLFTGEQAFF